MACVIIFAPRPTRACVAADGSSLESSFEFQSCVTDGNIAGENIQHDAQGEGGGFSVAAGTKLTLDHCLVTKNSAGQKVGFAVSGWCIADRKVKGGGRQ